MDSQPSINCRTDALPIPGHGKGGMSSIEIACDESGSDGENLIDGTTRVFAHGSTDLTLDEADDLVRRIRQHTGLATRELKSTSLLKPRFRDFTLEMLAVHGVLNGRAKVTLVDKVYMAVCKVVDLVIEEHAYRQGNDLLRSGAAKSMARVLFQEGPRAYNAENWDRLLRQFVSFARATQRTGSKTTCDELLETIDALRLRARRSRVEKIMEMLWESRSELKSLDPTSEANVALRGLDPVIPSVMETARAWHEATGRSVALVHDRQSALTPDARSILQSIANHPHPELPFKTPIEKFVVVDSHDDSRIQLADIIAGVGALAGRAALIGDLEVDLANVIRPIIVRTSLWADERSWRALGQ